MTSLFLRGDVLAPKGLLTDHVLEIARGRIVRMVPANGFRFARRAQRLSGGMLVPGFIDLQVNPVGSRQDMPALAAQMARGGCTGFLAAFITNDIPTLTKQLAWAKPWVGKATGGARLLGVHLEGPFLNPERRGVHPLRYTVKPTAKNTAALFRAAGDSLRMMTLAPEISGGMALAKRLAKAGVVSSIGHSNATYDQAMRSFDAGIRSATHIFNASSPLHQRAPGVPGAVLTHPGVTAQIIPDGVHVHPACVDMAYRLKGKGRLAVVTDALAGGGKSFVFAGRKIMLRGGKFTAADGTLAGGALDMAGAFARLQTFVKGQASDLIQCCSLAPAALLGLERAKGSLEPGKDADLVWLDASGAVKATWVGGEQVYVRDHRIHR